ncbi:large exoprotein [Microbacterium protaetiae]|uniref:Large exoprotein n=1 Tax=Microbacterium protaetiae TaxID=2509458 RepID=A0A4P6EEK4_9MICO|nr:large exoprotein [Microbacterium protaetiae]QAY60735.1 large exoprotein [Microbacterium protaetiae]
MGGQVLGGGIIVLVAVVLWLVYLLPSWYSRHQYDAAQRNAVRLNQALRVLAETSETPEEVRVELNARTALAQQKLARRAQAEREQLARKAQAERDGLERQMLAEREQAELSRQQVQLEQARLDRERADAERLAARERADAERAAAQARARAEITEARRRPEARRARARRRARQTVTVFGCLALAVAGWGGFFWATGGATTPVWIGGAVALVCALLLVRMARVGARAAAVPVSVAEVARERTARAPQDIDLADERAWQPRELPRPLTASAGSRAAAVVAAAAEREQVRQAALDQPLRERAQQSRPPQLDTARLARTGRVDDAEIEAHVRELLARRAAG